jgi:glutaredoxin
MSKEGYHGPSVALISKRGCHLCEQVIDALQRLKHAYSFDLTILYIEDDSLLFDKYWIKVPVVKVDGIDVFEANDLAISKEWQSRLEKLISSSFSTC